MAKLSDKVNEIGHGRDFVVNYRLTLIQNEKIFIHMDYYSRNLQEFIILKDRVFSKYQLSAMHPINYLISTEILKELIESVNFLHSMNPPIIHRDLKPSNVLMEYDINCKRFLKICDFGLVQNEVNTL